MKSLIGNIFIIIKYIYLYLYIYIGKSEYRESAIDVRKDIVYDSKKYKFIDKIFDEVDENDDKSFMCFTPLLYYDEDKNCYFVQEV